MAELLLLSVAVVFCVAVIYGAISDVTTYKIPNWISAVLVIDFVPFALLRLDPPTIALHVILGLTVFFICLIFWKVEWLGGGDVKLLSAVALWMGPSRILLFLVLLSLVAAAFSFLLIWLRNWNDMIQASGAPRLIKLLTAKAKEHACPYGLPIAIAALAVAPDALWNS